MAESIRRPDLSKRANAFSLEYQFNHPPAKVYRAWTEGLEKWFAVPGTLQFQLEVGKPFYFETEFEGARHPHFGRILALTKDRHLEFTWVTSATQGYETVVTVDLLPGPKGTHLHLTHAGFPDDISRQRHEEAWPKVLEHLDETI